MSRKEVAESPKRERVEDRCVVKGGATNIKLRLYISLIEQIQFSFVISKSYTQFAQKARKKKTMRKRKQEKTHNERLFTEKSLSGILFLPIAIWRSI